MCKDTRTIQKDNMGTGTQSLHPNSIMSDGSKVDTGKDTVIRWEARSNGLVFLPFWK